jgi:hypothetical protein
VTHMPTIPFVTPRKDVPGSVMPQVVPQTEQPAQTPPQ